MPTLESTEAARQLGKIRSARKTASSRKNLEAARAARKPTPVAPAPQPAPPVPIETSAPQPKPTFRLGLPTPKGAE